MTTQHTRNGFTLPLIVETTIGKQGKAGKQYYRPDYNELMVTEWFTKDDKGIEHQANATTPNAQKRVDLASSASQFAEWLGDWDTLVFFAGGMIDKCLYSAQCTTPENKKDGKPLTDSEKLAVCAAYLNTISEDTRKRTGVKSAYNHAVKAQLDYMTLVAKGEKLDMAKLTELLAAVTTAQAAIDAASE